MLIIHVVLFLLLTSSLSEGSEIKPGNAIKFCGVDFVTVWKAVCWYKQRQGIFHKRSKGETSIKLVAL